MIRNAVLHAGGAALLALALAAPLGAQRVDPTRIIEMHINAEKQNVSFDGAAVEGGKFRLTFPGGDRYAISPVQLDQAGRSFSITVFRLEGEKENEKAHAIETVRATRGTPTPLPSLPYVTVVIEEARSADASAADAGAGLTFASNTRRPVAGSFLQDSCCVSCSGLIACGCRVESSCGGCCVDPCCLKTTGGPAPGAGAMFQGPSSFGELAARRTCKTVPDHERLFTRREEDGTITLLAAR